MQTELQRLRGQCVGILVVGDLNVHQRKWLRFSSNDTPEGSLLYNITVEEGLQQVVKEPTRNEYLLDLVLTDIPGTTSWYTNKLGIILLMRSEWPWTRNSSAT